MMRIITMEWIIFWRSIYTFVRPFFIDIDQYLEKSDA